MSEHGLKSSKMKFLFRDDGDGCGDDVLVLSPAIPRHRVHRTCHVVTPRVVKLSSNSLQQSQQCRVEVKVVNNPFSPLPSRLSAMGP